MDTTILTDQSFLRIPDAGTTTSGRPISWFVDEQVACGTWREEIIPANVIGLSRDIRVFRAPRKTTLISFVRHGDKDTFCPPIWWDLAIGSGACGLGCRGCFLMLTHRIKRDPFRHLLYDNIEDYTLESEKWLKDPLRRPYHTLGIGIDRSDSLLYEGVAPHVRNLAPLFGNPQINVNNNKLVLLTKTINTHYLNEVPHRYRSNIIVSFSLNPEPVADLWEGKWPDTKERITPTISKRLDAAKAAQDMGFHIRVRVDPILTPEGWMDHYSNFLEEVKSKGINFERWTLGTYREKNQQLDVWREKWGLLPMEWDPDDANLSKDGTHRHLPEAERVSIYSRITELIHSKFPDASISLCKETFGVRKMVGLCNKNCNCLE